MSTINITFVKHSNIQLWKISGLRTYTRETRLGIHLTCDREFSQALLPTDGSSMIFPTATVLPEC